MGVPHSAQNLAPAAAGVPHDGQATAWRDPHSGQNLAPALIWDPQLEHDKAIDSLSGPPSGRMQLYPTASRSHAVPAPGLAPAHSADVGAAATRRLGRMAVGTIDGRCDPVDKMPSRGHLTVSWFAPCGTARVTDRKVGG